jgi:hypothetical protein
MRLDFNLREPRSLDALSLRGVVMAVAILAAAPMGAWAQRADVPVD